MVLIAASDFRKLRRFKDMEFSLVPLLNDILVSFTYVHDLITVNRLVYYDQLY